MKLVHLNPFPKHRHYIQILFMPKQPVTLNPVSATIAARRKRCESYNSIDSNGISWNGICAELCGLFLKCFKLWHLRRVGLRNLDRCWAPVAVHGVEHLSNMCSSGQGTYSGRKSRNASMHEGFVACVPMLAWCTWHSERKNHRL